jgi:hypothetical protein
MFKDIGFTLTPFSTEQNTNALYAVTTAANQHVKIMSHSDSSVSKLHVLDSKWLLTSVMYYSGVVVMKISTVWDTTPCSPSKACRSFGGTCRLHLQCRRISL